MIIVGSPLIESQELVLEGMQKTLYIALQLKKSPLMGAPSLRFLQRWGGRSHAQPFRLGSRRTHLFENTARFEQADIVRAAVEIVRQHIEHARHQRAAHD